MPAQVFRGGNKIQNDGALVLAKEVWDRGCQRVPVTAQKCVVPFIANQCRHEFLQFAEVHDHPIVTFSARWVDRSAKSGFQHVSVPMYIATFGSMVWNAMTSVELNLAGDLNDGHVGPC